MPVLGALLACVASTETPGGQPPTGTSGAVAGSCAPSAVIPAVLVCSFTSTRPGAGSVETWLADDPERISATPDGPTGTAHERSVLGLKAGRTYEYRLVVDDGSTRWVGPGGSHTVADVPAEFPRLTLEVEDARSETAGGYVLFAAAILTADRFTALAIVDGEGDYVWWYATPMNVLAISPAFTFDQRAIRVLQTDMEWEADIGTVRRIPLDGSDAVETRALLGHHTVVENIDGTWSWLGFDYQTFDGMEWASDAIRTAPEGTVEGEEPTQEFSWFDAYPVPPFSNPGTIDLVSIGDAPEFTHSNSLMAIDDGHFYVMSKLLDTLIKVDRQTGAIVWELGGRYSDFTHPGGGDPWRSAADNDWFSGSHMSDVWEGGMLVFDNADYTDHPTRAVEYAIDEERLEAEEVWEFVEPDGLKTGSMGDVRRLDGGNVLIEWSSLGYISEVTPTGEVVWRVRMDLPGHFGRITPLSDLYNPPVPRPAQMTTAQ